MTKKTAHDEDLSRLTVEFAPYNSILLFVGQFICRNYSADRTWSDYYEIVHPRDSFSRKRVTSSEVTACAAASMSGRRGGSMWSAVRAAPIQRIDSSDVFHR